MRKSQHECRKMYKGGEPVFRAPMLGTVPSALNMQELQIIWNKDHSKR